MVVDGGAAAGEGPRRADFRPEIVKIGLRQGRCGAGGISLGPFASSSASSSSSAAFGTGEPPAVPAPPSSPNKPGSSSSARSANRGSPSASIRCSGSRSGHSPPGGKTSAQTPVRQTGAGHGAERSRARRPDREASGVPGLGPDHAGTRVPPACADLRGLPADRAPRDDDARARTRPGQEVLRVGARAGGPGAVASRVGLPSLPPANGWPCALPRRGGSSGREMSWISGSRTSSSGPRPGSISGINDSSRSTGGTGRERPGGDDRPLPRPRLGSRPPGDSKSDGRGPAPAPGHSSMGDGRAGGGRCRPRSSPSMSPVRAGPAGPRNRCVRLGGRSGSSGSIGRKPRAGARRLLRETSLARGPVPTACRTRFRVPSTRKHPGPRCPPARQARRQVGA